MATMEAQKPLNRRMNNLHPAILIVIISTVFLSACKAQTTPASGVSKNTILTGADQVDKYLPYLKGKRVALFFYPEDDSPLAHLPAGGLQKCRCGLKNRFACRKRQSPG